ncbi:hypothetical protein V5799_007240, partial [Amblyomma americanum]
PVSCNKWEPLDCAAIQRHIQIPRRSWSKLGALIGALIAGPVGLHTPFPLDMNLPNSA